MCDYCHPSTDDKAGNATTGGLLAITDLRVTAGVGVTIHPEHEEPR